MSSPLSVRSAPFKSQGITFHVRGLTVEEFSILVERTEGKANLSASDFASLAKTCVVGWEDPIIKEGDDFFKLHFSPETFEEYVNLESRLEIGKFAYTHMTVLSDEEALKVKGYVHFLYYLSEEGKEKEREKSFNCEECVKCKAIFSRNCGRKDKKELIEKVLGKQDPTKIISYEIQVQESPLEKAKKKYGRKGKVQSARGMGVKKKTVYEQVLKTDNKKPVNYKLKIGEIVFTECPVSYIQPSLKSITSSLFHCVKSNIPYYNGGVADQPNKIFSIQRIIASESASIENARMKRDMKK
jgi:hypothetical protein